MSTRLKFVLLGLFLVQLGVLVWAYFGEQWNKTREYSPYVTYLENPTAVKSIDLSGLELTELIPEISQFVNVEYINLSDNKFKEIPEVLFKLPKLKVLNLSKNRIRAVEFIKNRSIERLDLSDNNIDEVEYHPCSVGCLEKLKMIDLSHNLLDESPDFGSSNLDTILMSNNELNSFYNIRMSMPSEHIVQHMDLSSNEIEGIDYQLYEFIGFDYDDLSGIADKCISLNVSDNFFEYFPHELFGNHKLKHLYIANCELNNSAFFDLDESVSKVKENNLEIIDFSNLDINLNSSFLEKFKGLKKANLTGLVFNDMVLKNETLEKLNIDKAVVIGNVQLILPSLKRLMVKENLLPRFKDNYLPNLQETITL